ncbi:tetratricopeptide repeat protein [Breznakibacter xylanolyticus]|uniref:Tetratricopeptide repeat protein n=1 Tax=Breznakibacter xylanolyticus TaxID=990 RepID=A0A2W7NDX0_9BACT|nr:tetratricopeptide repeat protein [Breznakibacter xylanolyticus]PZX18621.1 tetratricopeptide repeat protein [Breznakibacter xylanolyticus]
MKRFISFGLLACFVVLAHGQNADVQKSEAIMLETSRDYAGAAALYEAAAMGYEAQSVHDTLCLLRAGICYMRVKNYQKASDFFSKMETLNMASSELYLSMGENYAGLKKCDLSKDYFLKAIDLDASSKAAIAKKMATSMFNCGKYEDALLAADQVLADNPQDEHVMFIKVMAYEQLARYDDALAAGEALLAINPGHDRCIEKMGVLHCKKTDVAYDKEKKRYESMKNPTRVDFAVANRNLAAISQGYKNGIPYLEKVLMKNPNNAAVKAVLDNAKKRLE